MFVFSVDPSINNIGWVYCYINKTGENWQNRIVLLKSGAINVKTNMVISNKIEYIFHSLNSIISNYVIDTFLIEDILVSKNPYSSLILCRAQSILMSVALIHKINIKVYSCKTARKIVLNNGNANKHDVKNFIIDNTNYTLSNMHVYDAFLLVFTYWMQVFQ